MHRRELLKRGAAAGVVAWTAPIVLATNANAQEGCTPRCLPSGDPTFTASASFTCAAQLVVTVTLNADLSNVSCICDGPPAFSPSSFSRTLAKSTRGTQDFTETVSVTCLDNTQDECSRTYDVTVTVNITGNGNGCGQLSVLTVGEPTVVPRTA